MVLSKRKQHLRAASKKAAEALANQKQSGGPSKKRRVETEATPSTEKVLEGRRLLAASSLISTVEEMCSHSRDCTKGPVRFDKETKRGLGTKQYFNCGCGEIFMLSSDDNHVSLKSTEALSWGCQVSATGFSSATTLLNVLDMPTPNYRTFKKEQDQTFDSMMNALKENMKKWAMEEYNHAVEIGSVVVKDGKTYGSISVIVDGGWAKRSYKHSYNSSCGVAVIIGAHTGKVIYAGTKVKL